MNPEDEPKKIVNSVGWVLEEGTNPPLISWRDNRALLQALEREEKTVPATANRWAAIRGIPARVGLISASILVVIASCDVPSMLSTLEQRCWSTPVRSWTDVNDVINLYQPREDEIRILEANRGDERLLEANLQYHVSYGSVRNTALLLSVLGYPDRTKASILAEAMRNRVAKTPTTGQERRCLKQTADTLEKAQLPAI